VLDRADRLLRMKKFGAGGERFRYECQTKALRAGYTAFHSVFLSNRIF